MGGTFLITVCNEDSAESFPECFPVQENSEWKRIRQMPEIKKSLTEWQHAQNNQ